MLSACGVFVLCALQALKHCLAVGVGELGERMERHAVVVVVVAFSGFKTVPPLEEFAKALVEA